MTNDDTDFEILEFPDRHDIIIVWSLYNPDEWISSDNYVIPEP